MIEQSGLADVGETLSIGSDALYDLLARRLKRRPGYKLLTVLAPNDAGNRLVRLFSSDHDQYPLGDADAVSDNKWFQRLFVEREPVVANDALAILDWLPGFFDPETSDYGSLINFPVVIAGESVGLINLTAPVGHFSDDSVAAVRDEIPLAALAILAQRIAPGRADDVYGRGPDGRVFSTRQRPQSGLDDDGEVCMLRNAPRSV
jgi:hypothetical protein